MVSGRAERPAGNTTPTVPTVIPSYHDLVRSDVFPVLPANVGRLLDLGGGIGATSAALKDAKRASYVVVADRVAHHVLGGVDRAYSGNLEDEAFVARVISESGPFDTILALDILEHLRDPWKVVRSLHDGLTRNGVIVASIPNVNYCGLILPLVLRGRYDLTDAGILDRTHLRWFARHGAVELMTSSGLEVEVVEPNIWGRRHRRLNKITRGALTRFFALQYVIRARRVD